MESTWKFLFDNGESNKSVLLNRYMITLCMWGHVLLHWMDQMLNNQKLNLVHNVSCNYLKRELNSCDDMGRNRQQCICISTNFSSIGVQFLSSLGNSLYVCEISNLVLIPIWGLWKCIHITDFEKVYV